jgi:predicted transcriptional regulator
MTTVRINARVDAELAKKLDYLRARTGKSTTLIVREAIEAYYDALRMKADPAALLADFVSCAEGPADLSTQYKAELGRLLARKA